MSLFEIRKDGVQYILFLKNDRIYYREREIDDNVEFLKDFRFYLKIFVLELGKTVSNEILNRNFNRYQIMDVSKESFYWGSHLSFTRDVKTFKLNVCSFPLRNKTKWELFMKMWITAGFFFFDDEFMPVFEDLLKTANSELPAFNQLLKNHKLMLERSLTE